MSQFSKNKPAEEFTEQELNFLLQFIAASNFNGSAVKILHSIVSKIENHLNA